MKLFNRVFKKVIVKDEVDGNKDGFESMDQNINKMQSHISSMLRSIDRISEINKEKTKITYEMLELLNGVHEHFDKKIKRDEVV
ncbi:hypothetical protein [Fictibacillus phosphorivorans]|uniref:hypothetical protein n=1 Tax=Fictibacillus phosphorivorans TaxID=1221500 RepID=UPI00203ACAF0|nr:hypothetical protein [Fictibacillus phosphorivorans]MCM3719174.1 hypothetical protein [Fictibacillus phosphorivorans]MCM3776796.1 hypothetical protein [Fictibacillus phosphorivorans]